MKSREESARFIEEQMWGERDTSRMKGGMYHYGLQELRDLMDFVYEGEPVNKIEEISNNP